MRGKFSLIKQPRVVTPLRHVLVLKFLFQIVIFCAQFLLQIVIFCVQPALYTRRINDRTVFIHISYATRLFSLANMLAATHSGLEEQRRSDVQLSERLAALGIMGDQFKDP